VKLDGKKNGFFIKSRWTVRIILTILMSSLSQTFVQGQDKTVKSLKPVKKELREEKSAAASVADLKLSLKMTQKELEVLRKELADVLKQSDKRDKAYLRLQMSLAASMAGGSKKEYDKHSREALQALYGVSKSGQKLVSAVSECCDFLDGVLNHDKITDIDKARAKLRLDNLKTSAEKFHMRIQPRPDDVLFKSCRILTVNDKLQIVVLNVGTTSGVRNGILLRTKEGDCKLVIIAVRAFISAAVVTEGNMVDLARGMELFPGK